MDAAEKVERVIDWRRQREVLESLRRGRGATVASLRLGSRRRELRRDLSPAARPDVVILDGAYSARPSWPIS